MTLAEALEPTKRLEYASMKAIQAMAKKIPETQHEMFMVVINKYPQLQDQLEARSILNIALTPDNAMTAMNGLYGKMKENVDKPHQYQLAVNHERSTTEMAALLRDGTTTHNADREKSYGEYIQLCNEYPTAPEHYAERGVDYIGSYLLQTAIGINGLSSQEKLLLGRIASRIPLGLRDAFTVDISRNSSGELQVESLAISPNVVAQLTNMHIRHHQKTMELPREEYLKIAENLKPIGTGRTKP